ncbi:hypothetical protein BH09ACT10_BH09ACT10_25290 [soil metagenome]
MNDSQKIQHLLDLAEITKLKAQYGDYVDQSAANGME